MANTKEQTHELVTSDLLHNRNCFNYLRTLKMPDLVLESLPEQMTALLKGLQGKIKQDYDPGMAYGDLYTQFFDHLEEHIESIYNEKRNRLTLDHAQIEQFKKAPAQDPALLLLQKKLILNAGMTQRVKQIVPTAEIPFDKVIDLKLEAIQQEVTALDDFIISLYGNDNEILEDTFASIREITLAKAPVLDSLESSIAKHVSDKGVRVNLRSQTPAQAGSAYGRFSAMISDDFKPQHTTSLATVRKYGSNADSSVREFRFGTQGQRHGGQARVSPLFERFIEVQAARAADPQRITHIYFNNLGRDRTDAEGLKEKALTEKLEQFEREHANIAVITFPADKGLMHRHEYRHTKPNYNYQEVRDEFLHIALDDNTVERKIKDFYISRTVREKIFCDGAGRYTPELERAKLEALLDTSFATMGIDKTARLSGAQRQALWFHFVKFELTNHIIESLKPDSINFSCKDAIDRGGVSSAYYNLVKSFEPGKIPMSREEFDRALHAAPAMVKARGMNHHVHLIWNAVDAYVTSNYDQLKNDPQKAWIIAWRDFNCPHHRVNDLLKSRIQQLKSELVQAHEVPNGLITKALAIVETIEIQSAVGTSGKRLLLEAAARTTLMALHPKEQSPENLVRYEKVANELAIKHPVLITLGGLMKACAGIVSSLFTVGKKQDLLHSGIATIKAGFNASTRKELQTTMKEQLHALKEDSIEADAVTPKHSN